MKLIGCFLWFVVTSANALQIYGHRGARGLMPENTLPGYEFALAQGVSDVDLDIVMTKDGMLVAYHDLVLNKEITRDAKGLWVKQDVIVKQLTLKQLQTYDVGKIKPGTSYARLFPNQKSLEHVRIPTLKEVIDYVKKQNDHIGFQIEIKTDPTNPRISPDTRSIVTALNQLLKEEGIVSRSKVQAFDWQCLLLLQTINPDIPTAYLTSLEQDELMKNADPTIAGQWTGGYLLKNYASIPKMIKTLGGSWWDGQDIEMNQRNIEEAHRLGLKVAAWSWPERTNKDIDLFMINRLIALNIDGIITDRPDFFRECARRYC